MLGFFVFFIISKSIYLCNIYIWPPPHTAHQFLSTFLHFFRAVFEQTQGLIGGLVDVVMTVHLKPMHLFFPFYVSLVL